jgi:hypothetical protein
MRRKLFVLAILVGSCFAARDQKPVEGLGERIFPEEFEARNSHDPVIWNWDYAGRPPNP